MQRLPVILGCAALALSSPVAVQAQAGSTGSDMSSSEDITVTGRFGSDANAQSLSQAVSYADLDLSLKADRDVLRQRISLTARYLCDRLGESDNGSPIAPSCRDAAVKDALSRVGTVEEGFAPRGTKWTRPARWHAPYPDDWARRYP